MNKVALEGREDLLDLVSNNQEDQGIKGSILHTLRQRHGQNQLFTRLGPNMLVELKHSNYKKELAEYFEENS